MSRQARESWKLGIGSLYCMVDTKTYPIATFTAANECAALEDLRRTVAMSVACISISTEALEAGVVAELVTALKTLLEDVRTQDSHWEMVSSIRLAQTALAKLEKEERE